MLDQNYIKVYENTAGEITIAYAASTGSNIEVGCIQHISIKECDAHQIAMHLCRVADKIAGADHHG